MKASQSTRKHTDEQGRIEALLAEMTIKEKISMLAGLDMWRTVPVERLGIPSLVMTDGPHGVRSMATGGRILGPATSFPTGISMAASWDPDLMEQVGAALAEETRAMGCDILLGPCVNIVRHPLAGRNFESYSEDPHLAGRIGAAWIKGLQSRGVGASLKHLACNNQEFERKRGNSVVDERTLREIYLPQFEAVVKQTQPWTVMSSYNRVNGVYAAQNRHLLTEILRDEWGFEGMVVSDWGGNHATAESVQAGLDLEMPGPARYFGQLLVDAVEYWQIEQAAIDRAVRRILRVLQKAGKLDAPSGPAGGSVNTPEHQRLARRLAEKSIVLLKNEGGLLPLKPSELKTVAVIGANAVEGNIGGGGSSFVQPPYRTSPLEALTAGLGGRVALAYERGADNFDLLPPLEKSVLEPAVGEGRGLWGEYFDNADFSGEPVRSRVDPVFNFRRGSHALFDGRDTPFSIRWRGKLKVAEAGRYVFNLETTGVCRLNIDDKPLGENANTPSDDSPITRKAFSIRLEAGRAYSIRIEFVRPFWLVMPHLFVRFAATPEPDDRIERAVALARKSDAALLFVGLAEGIECEGYDRAHMDLPARQAELIEAVAAANPKTVVVVYCGSPVAMPWIERVPAAIAAFYPGQEGGHAVASVLLGEVNPSGRLPVTFPRRLEDTPAFTDYPGGREVRYGEGIFVGYRWYDRRDIEPLFPFGHGLSYTSFEYGEPRMRASLKAGESLEVALTVKNSGKLAGSETVQLYVADRQASLPRPPKELKAFAKIELAAGESRELRFSLEPRAFSFYDPGRKNWIAEPGEFEILIGSSSRDIRRRAALVLE